MPTSISLNSHFEAFIRKQVDSGRYNNVSEVVRAGLRVLEDQQAHQTIQLEEFRSAIAIGLEGSSIPAHEAFSRLEEKYQFMHDQQGA